MVTKKASPAQVQIYKKVLDYFSLIDFDSLSKASGFAKRKEKKLSGKNLVIGFMLMSVQGCNTFSHWAQEVSFITSLRTSKQAVFKRINTCFVSLVLMILNDIFAHHTKQASDRFKRMNMRFNYRNFYIQDSTLIQLPQSLNKLYPGNYSNGLIKSNLRIQIIIEIKSNKIVHFKITKYAQNDQSMSPLIFAIAQKGDMVIRDMGYFVMQVFEDMTNASIKFITRLKPGVKMYNPRTGAELDLVKLLKNRNKIDQQVLVGSKNKLLLRMVAIRMPEEQANERIRKEKNNRDRRHNRSKAYYQLLRYSIYLTTESPSELKAQDISKLYDLRWRIESIFKTWKSELNLQNIIATNLSMSKERAESIIYLMLIFILSFQLKIYNQVTRYLSNKKEVFEISLTKLTKYIVIHFNKIVRMDFEELIGWIVSDCCYEKRNDRKNYLHKIKLS